MSKVHAPIFEGLVRTLEVIFAQGHHADKVIERVFKANRKWGSRDRRLFAESVYEIVRWKGSLHAIYKKMGGTSETPYREWAQIWFAAFQDEHLWISPWMDKKGEILKIRKSLDLADRESFPPWFVKTLEEQMGSKAAQVLHELNAKPPVFLRANTLKGTVRETGDALQLEGYPTKTLSDESLMLLERKNVFGSQAFKKGLFEVQDLSSQQVADFVGPKPGEFIIDACAGAGGKSLHLAARMENRGRILALDVKEKKLAELKVRSRRAGVNNLEAKLIESSKTIKRQEGKADRLLLDVPCTGSGVIRRNPDAKWKLSLERLKELEGLQAEILDQYSKMLKAGGLLVYATCSIFPSENERQVEAFLSRNETFSLLDQRTILPRPNGGDGFYMARMKRR